MFIGGYVESLDIFGITTGWPVYLFFYAVFVGVHLIGVGEALKVMFAITAVAVVALIVFVLGMIPEFSASNLTDIDPDTSKSGASDFLPFGYAGVLSAFVYGIWFFLAVEGVPLAAEESRDPKRDMPRGIKAMGAATVSSVVFMSSSRLNEGGRENTASGFWLFGERRLQQHGQQRRLFGERRLRQHGQRYRVLDPGRSERRGDRAMGHQPLGPARGA